MQPKGIMKSVFMILSIIFALVVVVQNISFNNEIKMYENFWGIMLPSKYECIYKWNNQDSFHGEGIRYSKYQILENNSSIFTDYSCTKNNKLESSIISLMASYDISEKQKIDFNSSYCWKYLKQEQDSLLIIYSLNTKNLFLIQNTE